MPTTEFPSYDLPLRAADIDILHHVNNVIYLDYAAEARVLLAADGLLAADLSIASIGIDFVQPLQLSRRPVTIANAWQGDVLRQEVCHEEDGGRIVFARIETAFGDPGELLPAGTGAPSYPARVRHADLGRDGQVTLSKVFELFQEARTLYVRALLAEIASNRFVIAHVDVILGPGLPWRRNAYASRSWMTRVGNSSATVETEIFDGDTVHAHATTVIVGFDAETQAARTITAEEHAALTRSHRGLSPGR